jgi:HK97 family phage major capsid protein
MAVNIIGRHPGTDPLVPEPFVAEVLQNLPKASAALNLCRTVPMSTKTSRQPVLSVLPDAFWVQGDTGMKTTTKADWENLELVAEELAVIIPIPEAYLSDAAVPIRGEIRPLVTQAFGQALDRAVLFGTNKPATWTSQAIIPGIVAAGNTVAEGDDIGVSIAGMGEKLAGQGFNLNSYASRPGFHWRLAAARTLAGYPIYGAGDLANGVPSSLYGRPLSEVENGSWVTDPVAQPIGLIGGEFNKGIIGLRQDLTFKVFDSGVISNPDGTVAYNLMQQDMVALRVVMRVGYALANPVTTLEPDEAKRFPFVGLTPKPKAGVAK